MSYQLANCVEIVHEEWNRVTLEGRWRGRENRGGRVCVCVKDRVKGVTIQLYTCQVLVQVNC